MTEIAADGIHRPWIVLGSDVGIATGPMLGAAISALLSFHAPDLGSQAALIRLIPSFAAVRLEPTRAAVQELIEGLDIDTCSAGVSYDGHTALRICRSYSKRHTGGSRVPRTALSDIQIDAHDVEQDLIRQALVAFRTAAADTGHVLVVEHGRHPL